MFFESELDLKTKTTTCGAHGLERDRDTGTLPKHTLHMNHGETLTLLSYGPHGEVREIEITVSGSVTMFEDTKTNDAFLVRRTKNVSTIGEVVTVGQNQIV